MKNQIDEKLINGLVESDNDSFFETINQSVYNMISLAVEALSQKSQFVRSDRCILLPVNENATGTLCQLSKFCYFLGIDNPQLEANSKSRKNFWKYVWREFRARWRIGRKKKYKKENLDAPVSLEKYSISNFKHDVMNSSLQFLSTTSLVSEYQNCLCFEGKDDFGSNVQICVYVCCYDSENGTFKMLLNNKRKFLPINFGQRFENLDALKQEGKIYFDMLKVFNALYCKFYNRVPNQILMESLIFNCPRQLFKEKDVYKTFINVANFLRICDPKRFRSIRDMNLELLKDPLITKTSSQVEFNRLVAMLDEI